MATINLAVAVVNKAEAQEKCYRQWYSDDRGSRGTYSIASAIRGIRY